MPLTIEVLKGSAAVEVLTLKDRANNVVTTFTGAATLSAALWAGDDQAALLVPTVAWYTDGSDGKFTLTVSAAQTATLTPGDYPVRLTITAGGIPRSGAGPVATLRVLDAPGSGTAPAVYGSADDLARYFPAVNTLPSATDQTGFAEQRGRARAWLDDVLLARDSGGNWSPNGSRVFPGWGYYGVNGADWGPSQWLRDKLAAGALIVREITREIVAKKALSYVLEAQISTGGENPYEKLAQRFDWQAEQLVKTYRAELDNSGNGSVDYVINCGATSLR